MQLSIYLWLFSPLLNYGRFFSFFIPYTVGRTPWTWDQPVARPLPAHRTTQTQNKRTQTSIPWVVFEATTPVFERAKIVHALDGAATVIGKNLCNCSVDIDKISIRTLKWTSLPWVKTASQNVECLSQQVMSITNLRTNITEMLGSSRLPF
jgi:hypothetical protein